MLPARPNACTTRNPNARIQRDCQARSEKGLAKQREVPRGMELSPYLGLIYVEGQVLVGGDPNDINDLIAKGALPLQPHERAPESPQARRSSNCTMSKATSPSNK